jgi:hypothetical protein
MKIKCKIKKHMNKTQRYKSEKAILKMSKAIKKYMPTYETAFDSIARH